VLQISNFNEFTVESVASSPDLSGVEGWLILITHTGGAQTKRQQDSRDSRLHEGLDTTVLQSA
jgi:hypothetical protein